MEKKVNLSIFFNYRHYSPRFKMLLEDTFYKKMHDEKLSSSDAMQQVMKFCNDVNEIEYDNFDFGILSRYSKADKTLMINSNRVSSLISEHKDLDEEALLKNILEKQAKNIIEDNIDEFSDVTFDDVLNKGGYMAPRKLSDISQDIEKTSSVSSSFEGSAVNDMLTPKIATKSEINTPLEVTGEDKRFISSDETVQINRVQNELKDRLYENKKVEFENFFPEEGKGDTNGDSYFQKVGVLSKRLNIESEPEDDYSILDAVKKNDTPSEGGKFSDFVPEKKDEDYELEDDDESSSKKSKPGIFSNMKEKVSAFTDKIKTNMAKRQEEEEEANEFDTEIVEEDEDIKDDFNYADNLSINENQKEDTSLDAPHIQKEEKNDMETSFKESSTPNNDFSFIDDSSDMEINDRFDNIIMAIMKEKQKEIEEDELISSYDEAESASNEDNLTESKNIEEIAEEEATVEEAALEEPKEEEPAVDKHLESVYDSFAEELETIESVKRRRRRR